MPDHAGTLTSSALSAAKVAFPDLSLRECMLLGGYDDEELDKVKDQKHTVSGILAMAVTGLQTFG